MRASRFWGPDFFLRFDGVEEKGRRWSCGCCCIELLGRIVVVPESGVVYV